MIQALSQSWEPDGGERERDLGPVTLELQDRISRAIAGDGEGFVIQPLIDQIPDFVFVKDLESRFVIANAAIARAYGLTPAELVGLTDFDLHPTEQARGFYSYERYVLDSGRPQFNMEESFPDSDGVQKFYSTTKVPLRDKHGTVVGLIGIARDITESKLLRSFELQQADILSMIATKDDLETVLNKLVALIEEQMKGIKASVLLFDAKAGRLKHCVAPNLPPAYCQAVNGVEIGPSVGSCGTAVHRRAPVVVSDICTDPLWGAFRDLAVTYKLRSCWSIPIFGHSSRVLGTLALYSSDVRGPAEHEMLLIEMAARIAGIAIERHLDELQLVHMAHYDALTELPNRALFVDRLTAALAEHTARRRRVALLYIDLDGFKQVNDQLGHHFGDLLLREVGLRLRRFASDDVMVARLGGDEFAAIHTLPRTGASDASSQLATAIIAALSEPFEVENHRLVAGATIGIAVAPDDDDQPGSLLRDADLALYRAKSDHRGGYRFYDPEMSLRAQRRRQLEADLRRAVEEGAFQLHYQPIVSLKSGDVCAFEALLRWHDGDRGFVPPQEFVPTAEELGLILPIGRWVLNEACLEASRWPQPLTIAVNLSPVQFQDGRLYETVVSALALSGLTPSRLELEITESVLLIGSDSNLDTLHKLRALGVQISLDDFGIGYSSLSYLRSFPFTRIKVDRSFVQDIEQNPGCRAIIRAVAQLASDLDMRTTAEGVETEEQLDKLLLEGCQEGQGYLFSRPVPASSVQQLMRSRIGRTAAAAA